MPMIWHCPYPIMHGTMSLALMGFWYCVSHHAMPCGVGASGRAAPLCGYLAIMVVMASQALSISRRWELYEILATCYLPA